MSIKASCDFVAGAVNSGEKQLVGAEWLLVLINKREHTPNSSLA
jgi:hypothetical protein